MNKRILKFGILVICLTLFFASCQKDEKKVTFSGTIVDSYSNNPISGASVTLASKKIESGVYNSNFQNITTISTDANGQYSIESPFESVIAYKIFVGKSNYFDFSTEINSNDVPNGSNYNATYSISPAAYIKLHIKNNVPFDSLDMISYSYKNTQPGCIDCCNNNIFQGIGQLFETTFKCKTFGNTTNKIEWRVTKNGTMVLHSQDVFCAPFDTTNFEILY
ncbi:MAG: carboxypeptidase regulatory-like domain-containing protein [Bacteroidetes bacterium]|nr:carboxypeptidase regulatory-like domain-containing protein [Bacteroidota bacterium]